MIGTGWNRCVYLCWIGGLRGGLEIFRWFVENERSLLQKSLGRSGMWFIYLAQVCQQRHQSYAFMNPFIETVCGQTMRKVRLRWVL